MPLPEEVPDGFERVEPDQVNVGDEMLGPIGTVRVHGIIRSKGGDRVSIRKVREDGTLDYPGFGSPLRLLCDTHLRVKRGA